MGRRHGPVRQPEMCYKVSMPPRKTVDPTVEERVLSQSARRCCLCFQLERDFGEKHGQIAHLDHNSSNGSEDNLAFLCLKHHTIYDSTASQHKNFTIREVKASRRLLYDTVQQRNAREWVIVLNGHFSDFNKARIEVISEQLRSLLDDPLLSIKRVSPGSVRLIIQSSEEAYGTFIFLFKSHRATELQGFCIEDVYPTDGPEQASAPRPFEELPDEARTRIKELLVAQLQEMSPSELAIVAATERSLTRYIETAMCRIAVLLGYAIAVPLTFASGLAYGFREGFEMGFRDGSGSSDGDTEPPE